MPCYAISDHYPVCVTWKKSFANNKKSFNEITYRRTKYLHEDQFINYLLITPFNCCYETSLDPDVALQSLYKAFTSVIDHHKMPIISKRVKHPTQQKWIATDISAAMHKRDKYKKQNNHVEYKIWQNSVLRLVRDSKKNFYINSIAQNKNSPKEFWKHVKELCPNTKLKNPNNFQINSNLISNPEIVADTLIKQILCHYC